MKNALSILNSLNSLGYNSYIVGGAVRDYLLGVKVSDIDIATNARPEVVMELFPNTYPSGIKFGTVTVMIDKEGYEVTTFRSDGEYLDGRRPESIIFSDKIEDDLSRRDFTINSMAMDKDGVIIDLFSGRDDLANGIIRCVGNPKERFIEDGLRILRAFRFSSRFGFKVDKETLMAIRESKENIKNVSSERIREELTKILLSDNVEEVLTSMYESGILDIILPDISKMYNFKQNNPYHIYDLFTHTLKSVKNSPKDELIRWVMLLHDTGKVYTKENINGVDHFHEHNKVSVEITEKIFDQYRFSTKFKNEALELIYKHDRELIPTERSIRRLLNQFKHTTLDKLLDVKKADYLSQDLKYLNERLSILEMVKEVSLAERKITAKDLKVNGYDLIELGLQGREVGEMLNYLLEIIIDNPSNNDKKILIELVKSSNKG